MAFSRAAVLIFFCLGFGKTFSVEKKVEEMTDEENNFLNTNDANKT